MEPLQQAWNDLVRRMRETPRGTQVLLAIAAILCLAMLAFFNRTSTTRSEVNLLPGMSLTLRQLPAYEMAFAKAGLQDYRIEKQNIWVPQSKKATFMAALSSANLLSATSGKIVKDALDASSPFENQQQRKHRIKIARQQELAQEISQFKGIEEATVRYDTVEKKGIQQVTVCTASVTARAINNQQLTAEQAQIIRNYLAGCIAGLEPDDIYIVDLNRSHATHRPRSAATNPSEQYKDPTPAPPVAAGTLAILGSALLVGCIALWKRKKGPVENRLLPASSSFQTELSGQVIKPNSAMLPDAATTQTLAHNHQEMVDDKPMNARLLLPGQSDYSHLIPAQQTDGIELTTLAIDAASASSTATDTPVAEDKMLFEFVHQASPDELFEILENETPETIAIVFSHLPPDHAAHVLNHLPHAVQLQVLKSLSDLDEPNEDMERQIGKTLADRLKSLVERNEKRKAGIQAVSDMLGFIDVEQRDSILDRLQSHDANFASRLQRVTANHHLQRSQSGSKSEKRTRRPMNIPQVTGLLTSQNMLALSGEDLCKVFTAVDPRDAVVALSHWDSQIAARLTNDMQPEEALRLKKMLKSANAIPQREAMVSCDKVLEVASRLEESGKIRSLST